MYFDRSHGTLGCIIFFHSEQLQEKPWNLASSIRLTKLTDSVSPFYKNGITTSRCFLTYMTLILYSPLGWKSTCIHKNPSNIMLLQTKARHNACATICLSPSTYFGISSKHCSSTPSLSEYNALTASTSGECLCYSAWNTAQGFTGCAELFYMLIWFSFANTKNNLD